LYSLLNAHTRFRINILVLREKIAEYLNNHKLFLQVIILFGFVRLEEIVIIICPNTKLHYIIKKQS